jgi:outer membrane protein TolC
MATFNYIKKFTLSVVIILFMISLTCRSQTVDDYLKEALKNNPGVQAKYSEYKAALEIVLQVGSLPDPVFDLGIPITPVETNTGPVRTKMSIMQMFPWIGTLGLKKDASALEAKARYETFVSAKNDLVYKVKKVLFRLYEINRSIDISQANIETLRKYTQLTMSGGKMEKSKMLDAIRIQLSIIQSETDLKILKDRKRPLEVEFNNLLNREADVPVVAPKSLDITEIETLSLRDSLLNNPAMKKVGYHLQASTIGEKIRYYEGLPTFGAGFDYLIIGKADDEVKNSGRDAFMPVVSVSIPMYRKKNDAALRESKFLQEAYSHSKNDIKNILLTELEEGLFNYRSAWESLQLSISEVSKTDQVLRLLISEYSKSGTDFVEVLRMQQQKFQYNLEKEKAIVNLNIAIARIEYLTGRR